MENEAFVPAPPTALCLTSKDPDMLATLSLSLFLPPQANGDRHPREIRLRMSNALSNLVHAHPSDRQCRREAKVLRLLETLRVYADLLRDIHRAAMAESSSSSTNASEAAEGCRRLLPHGCRPVTLRIPSPAAASPSASASPAQQRQHLIPDYAVVVCGESFLTHDRTGKRRGGEKMEPFRGIGSHISPRVAYLPPPRGRPTAFSRPGALVASVVLYKCACLPCLFFGLVEMLLCRGGRGRWEGGREAAPSVVGRRERSERLMWRFIAAAVTTTEGGSFSSSLCSLISSFPPPKGEEGNHPRRCAALCGRKREGRSFCVTTLLPLLFPSLCSMTF